MTPSPAQAPAAPGVIDLEAEKAKLRQGITLADTPALVDKLIAEVEALRERMAELETALEGKLLDLLRVDHLGLSKFMEKQVGRAEAAEAGRAELAGALGGLVEAVDDLINESHGVDGLHLNGDVAPWDSLLPGGEYESWLLAIDPARAALAATPEKPKP